MSVRLFVAADLPAACARELAAFRDAADPAVWRPVADDALHITLAFLGHRPEGDAAVAAGVLDAAAGPAPRLAVAGALLLPPRRGRVLCAAIADHDGTLAALQARVSEGLEAAGSTRPSGGRSGRTRRWRGCAPTPGRRAPCRPGSRPRAARVQRPRR